MADYYSDYYRESDGRIKTNYMDSEPWWQDRNKAPKNAPNIVYVVVDDMGYADLGCYGSRIDTPNIDGLANGGLKYNEFHVNAMCSPTRASLLSGCNHHSVGMGHICGDDMGFPGYRALVDKHYGMISETLKENGYITFALGKWHLTPDSETTANGPFTNWPLSCGFDKFYGFLGACTNQYNPALVCGNEFIKQPKSAADGYHLSEDLVDHAIQYVADTVSNDPAKPFFCYLAFGALHSPHQVPKKYVDRYRGRFDDGWSAYRRDIIQKQISLGIAPEGTQLTPDDRYDLDWDALSDSEKRICARYMENYAGFLTHTDEQLGRFLDFLKKCGKFDNTLIVFMADNGASAEGQTLGTKNTGFNFVTERDPGCIDEAEIDLIGTDKFGAHYPRSWAHSSNTPFQLYKSWNHNGGIKVPFIVSWPESIRDAGALRTQYHHVIDVNATVLDVLGIRSPEYVKGVPQAPKHGVSMRYSFDDAAAKTHRHVQYYEMCGNRGIWADGWKAVADHAANPEFDFGSDRWELYNTNEDFAENHNLAAQYPEKLNELKELWWHEAGKYGVLPMIESHMKNREGFNSKHMYKLRKQDFRSTVTLYPECGLGVAAKMMPGSFTATAYAKYKVGDEGVLFANGDNLGGYALYIRDGRLQFDFNWFSYVSAHMESASPLPEGDVEFVLDVDESAPGAGTLTLKANGAALASTVIEASPLFRGGAAFAVGRFPHVGVNGCMDELGDFCYTNAIDRLVFRFQRPATAGELGAKLEEDIEND